MASRLNQPGVEVQQLTDERRPTVFRPVMVPCIFGIHNNIQKNLDLVYHADGAANSGVVIASGLSTVTSQIISSSSLSVYAETTRGLAPLTITTHYTASFDIELGVTNLITIKDPIDITKQLVSTNSSTSINSLSSAGTNYVIITDTGADFSQAGIKPGDLITIDFATSVRNSSGAFTGQDLTVVEVSDSQNLKSVWSNNNSSWVSEYSVSYAAWTPTMTDVSGQILVSYTGRVINDVNKIVEIISNEDARNQFGVLEPENPLGYHVLSALSATDKSLYAMRVATDDTAGYDSALDSMRNEEDIYFVVPTTQSSTVASLCEVHVDYMSLPENKAERVAFINRTVPDYDVKFNLDTPIDILEVGPASTGLSMSDAGWTSGLPFIVPGDIWRPNETVILSNGSVVNNSDVRLTVIAKSGTVVTVSGAIAYYNGLAAPATTAVEGFFTTTNYTKDNRAKYLSALGEAYDNKRIINVVPDNCKMFVSRIKQKAPTWELYAENAEETVNGTNICASLAAYASAVAPSKPLTNEIVPGITDLIGSNDIMTNDHLDTIAGGGNWILIRTRGGGISTTRHQLTTAVSDVNTREFSVVKSIDFAAKTFRAYLRPLVGKSTITDNFIKKVLRPVTFAAMHALIEGGTVSGKSSVLSIVQNTDDPTKITIEVKIVPLYPANYFVVKIYV